MKKLLIAAIVLVISSGAYAAEEGAHGAHWGYSGEHGPKHWGELDHAYSACGEGKNQSPINLTGFIESELEPIEIHYEAGGKQIVNNGHAIQVNFAPGSKIMLDGRAFKLKQFHFHAPSENHIEGKSFPMEAHLVHADKAGNLAVVAVMFVEGEPNPSIASVWAYMPGIEGGKQLLPSGVSAEGILPSNRDYYRFSGSLTTPPCTEGVWWIVMKESVTVSKDQIEKFANVMGGPNNRPIQPLNGRPVLK
jgi:carbonic anhydrase